MAAPPATVREGGAMPIKHSFAWGAFSRRVEDHERLFSEAKEMGYHGVDLAARDAWAEIRDAGMTIASIGGHKSLASTRPDFDRICPAAAGSPTLTVRSPAAIINMPAW